VIEYNQRRIKMIQYMPTYKNIGVAERDGAIVRRQSMAGYDSASEAIKQAEREDWPLTAFIVHFADGLYYICNDH
jgi:hypothetical protein